MKILHLALQAPYNEGWGYQENLLPKYQAKLGHDVTLVVSCTMNSFDSNIIECEPEDYISPDKFRVIRLKYEKFFPSKFASKIKYYKIFNLLKEIKPDFIMVHGVTNFSALQVKRYIKKVNKECTVIADNHLDYNNCNTLKDKNIKSKCVRVSWKFLNFLMNDCYKKVYGVSPKRVDILSEIFGFRQDKLDLLPAGADDDQINFSEIGRIRSEIRKKHNINKEDFLIVTGGKIDSKKNIDKVMSAVAEINKENIKLLVFGGCSEDMNQTIDKFAEHSSIRYIGWISSEETYNYFLASDLILFPGLHSVMWEQACATKVPCVFRRLDGFEHLDNGGNCEWIENPTVSEIKNKIIELFFSEKYDILKKNSSSEVTDVFLYSNIAKKSLEN